MYFILFMESEVNAAEDIKKISGTIYKKPLKCL